MKLKALLATSAVVAQIQVSAQTLTTAVRYHKDAKITEQTVVPVGQANNTFTDARGCRWTLTTDKKTVNETPQATDYTFTWTLTQGEATEVSFAIDFAFDNWTPENYVFIPAAVYDGNRFAVKDVAYPPFWYDKNEWRLDMPTTTTVQPTLGRGTEEAAIELTTGNASTPLLSFFSKKEKRAWMVQTRQGNVWGNYGLSVMETKGKNKAHFLITAPAMRTGNTSDVPARVQNGEHVTMQCRVYNSKAKGVDDLMARFMEVRKSYNEQQPIKTLPYSEAWKLLNNLYQTRRWDDRINMYWLSDVCEKASWNFIWQLGWCGGGQATLPILTDGAPQDKVRALRNLETVYTKTQAPSGFFYAYGDGKEFFGFGYGKPLDNNITFIRSQGDWLYMAQRQFAVLEKAGQTVNPVWLEGTRKQAEAFAKIWEANGQFGQFADVETGDLRIGGSVAGAIVPSGLVLASKRYNEPRYLEIAKAAARKYYEEYVTKGYTTGGPGEILSTPDAESAFALFQSFMVLYENTFEKEWLAYAAKLLPICAGWTVSYDYKFPDRSPMGMIDARSCGSVWASVANKHSAPGICTWSGDCLLNYYRASGDARALDLITDIAHGITQYVARTDRSIGNMPPGGVCERVNLSDWEGKEGVGGNIFGSCSWCEVGVMLTVTQLPGVYIQPDKGVIRVFDHVRVSEKDGTYTIANPTSFDAAVRVYVEQKPQKGAAFEPIDPNAMKVVTVKAGESVTMDI